jgi:predicted transcriptional regulator
MNDLVKLPKLLAARLEKVSHVQRVPSSAIARKAIAEHLSYLEWKERAIALGDADLAAGRVMTTAQIVSMVAKRRAKRVAKAKKTA